MSATLTEIMSPKQLRFLKVWQQFRHKQVILSGAVSAGKTFISLWAFLLWIRHAPKGGHIIMVGRTLGTLNTNVMQLLMNAEIFGHLAAQVKYTPGAKEARIMGRTVYLYGASDVGAETKIRGMTVSFAYVDEATLLPEGFWNMLITRLRVPRARLLATTNPDSRNHWLRKKWILKGNKTSTAHITLTMDDNPSLEPEYIALQKASYSGVFYERFILGRWVAAEGAVYRGYSPDKHLMKWGELPKIARCLSVGIDYGTTNTTAAVLLGITAEKTPRLVILDTWGYDSSQHDGVTLPDIELSRRLRQWVTDDDEDPKHHPAQYLEPEFWFLDPSAASLSAQLSHDGQPTWKADNSVLKGIASVSNLLSNDRIIFARETCAGLLEELTEYAWDAKKQDEGIDQVVKKNDHYVDALRYAIQSTIGIWQPILYALAA